MLSMIISGSGVGNDGNYLSKDFAASIIAIFGLEARLVQGWNSCYL
jgi:hypothetical protein